MILSGWGQYPKHDVSHHAPQTVDELSEIVISNSNIARGNGRAYGDSAINRTATVDMRNFNKLLSFDCQSGELVSEAGVLLSDVIDVFLPRGWFPKVTPGTKFVTLGGMAAADVHGKNHHKDGAFSGHVNWLEILSNNGKTERCSRSSNPDLFNWSLGGMGLTGIITQLSLTLRPIQTSWITQRKIIASNIDRAIDIFEDTISDTTYSVAWIDCLARREKLGRSVITLGDHANVNELPQAYRKSPLAYSKKRNLRIPFYLPSSLLNQMVIATFNSLYFNLEKKKKSDSIVALDRFFYPLDCILEWNKMYGRRGFTQLQCVIPLDSSRVALREILELTSTQNCGSFLAVLKRFGKQTSLISFPMEGYTLALDFPNSVHALNVVKTLHRIVCNYGGRFYLAKDSLLTEDELKNSDKRFLDYTKYRIANGMTETFNSEQSKRLGI